MVNKLTPAADTAAQCSKMDWTGKCQRQPCWGPREMLKLLSCARACGTLLVWKVLMRRHFLKG